METALGEILDSLPIFSGCCSSSSFCPSFLFSSVLKMLGTLQRRQFDVDKIRESEDKP
jgi:hypothetical protein